MRKIASFLLCGILLFLFLNSIRSVQKEPVAEVGVQATPAPLAAQTISNAPRRVDITPIPMMGVK